MKQGEQITGTLIRIMEEKQAQASAPPPPVVPDIAPEPEPPGAEQVQVLAALAKPVKPPPKKKAPAKKKPPAKKKATAKKPPTARKKAAAKKPGANPPTSGDES